jgi:hypothetical protein
LVVTRQEERGATVRLDALFVGALDLLDGLLWEWQLFGRRAAEARYGRYGLAPFTANDIVMTSCAIAAPTLLSIFSRSPRGVSLPRSR